jgi:hypothetical protein
MEEENKSMENQEAPVVAPVAPKKPEKVLHNYLQNKRIKVVPVGAGAKWSNLLVGGEEKRKDPFLFDKIKRSYQVPFKAAKSGGGLHTVLDNTIPRYTVQYPNEKLTEQQFFEKVLGVDLNPLLPRETNFWMTDKRSRVVIDKKGLVLDLKEVMGMLKYKILLSNRKKVAPSPEMQNQRASYEFMLVDESVKMNKMAAEADLKSKAMIKYAQITQSTKTMLDFIKVTGKGFPTNPEEVWLKSEIFKMCDTDPRLFLSYAEDDYYELKILIHDGVKVGALRKLKDNLYSLDNGYEIGTLNDTITYLSQPDNQAIVARIETLKQAQTSANGNS